MSLPDASDLNEAVTSVSFNVMASEFEAAADGTVTPMSALPPLTTSGRDESTDIVACAVEGVAEGIAEGIAEGAAPRAPSWAVRPMQASSTAPARARALTRIPRLPKPYLTLINAAIFSNPAQW
jgi:hypothetical protein